MGQISVETVKSPDVKKILVVYKRKKLGKQPPVMTEPPSSTRVSTRSSSKGCPDNIKGAHRKSTKQTDTHRGNTDMGCKNAEEPALIASSLTKVTSGLMRDENLTTTREDGSSAMICKPTARKSETETIAASSSVERMKAKDGQACESDCGFTTTAPWMEVLDPEQAEQELKEELRDVDNPWVV